MEKVRKKSIFVQIWIFCSFFRFSMISRFSLRICQKACYMAETSTKPSFEGGKQLHLPFFWYFENFPRYGRFKVQKHQKWLIFGIFGLKMVISGKKNQNIKKMVDEVVSLPQMKVWCKFQPYNMLFDRSLAKNVKS